MFISAHDELTGVYNRAFFDVELKRLDTKRQLPISLIMGDVDGLKITNDAFGHQEGDNLLKTVARLIKGSCRSEDIVARWGGDEFIILLPKTSGVEAMGACNRIKKACGLANGKTMKPSISLGYATKEDEPENIYETLKKAEDRMYRSKFLEGSSIRSTVINSLRSVLIDRKYETQEHPDRMIELCKKIVKEKGLPENDLDDVELIAMLHDIGKIAIKESILLKPGKLTEEEWEEVKRHSEIGYRITQLSHELSHISDCILGHHERWDGTGYPQGLKGTEIPLLARIVSVVDAYDVMTHSRPYKDAISREEAIEEIIRCSGTQFDSEIVEIFLRAVKA